MLPENMTLIRKYVPTDKDAVMNLIRLNTPAFLQRKFICIDIRYLV